MTESEVTKMEMVTLLVTSNRTHSHLMDQVPEKCGITGQPVNFEDVLKEVHTHFVCMFVR